MAAEARDYRDTLAMERHLQEDPEFRRQWADSEAAYESRHIFDDEGDESEQEVNEAAIAELQNKLARADVINVSGLSGDTVKFGAIVTIVDEDTGEKRRWQIVGEPEADARRGKISVFSPLARALIGKTKNATVEVLTPSGAKAYRISNVQWG